MDADSDKSLQEELQRFTTGQNGLSESDTGPTHKVCSMFSKLLLEVTKLRNVPGTATTMLRKTKVMNSGDVTMCSLIDGYQYLVESSLILKSKPFEEKNWCRSREGL